DRELRNMGTTVVVAVWLRGPEIYLASVGDSRAYLIRKNSIDQLTRDDSLAQALVESRTISASEVESHPLKTGLQKYLGAKEAGEGPEIKSISIRTDDRLLLCSDGLCGPVDNHKLLACVREHPDAQQCADKLGQLALDSGSRDNVSCIVIQVV